jgi:hypothetical protein
MKIKYSEALNILDACKELLKIDINDIKVRVKIVKNIRNLENLLKTYTECDYNLLTKYAIKDDDGNIKVFEDNTYRITPKYIPEYNKQKNELLNVEDEVELLHFTIDELSKVDNISNEVLLNLANIIDE